MAIIKDGRLVASGRVEELRDRGAGERRVRVEVQAADEWLPAGAGVVDRGPRGVLVALDGLPPDAVLDAARRRHGQLLRARAPDPGRPVPGGGGGERPPGGPLVTRREITERVREKSFLVSTAVNLVIIVPGRDPRRARDGGDES